MKAEYTHTLIIGSGVAGTLIAKKILDKNNGETVTMLEAGPKLKMNHYDVWLDMVLSGKKPPYKDFEDHKDDFRSEGDKNNLWYITGGRLFAGGGSTLHWGGWCPRMKPEDFELKSRLGRYGLDWLYSYSDLEPYYTEAEYYLQVAGDSAEASPPRNSDYPYPAPAYTFSDGLVIKALEQLGIGYSHLPIARNGKAINGYPPCQTIGTCDYCPVGGRFTGNQPLQRLENARLNTFEIRYNAPALEILVKDRKKATAVVYMDRVTQEEKTIEADRIIVCAGSIETAKLLLNSRNKFYRNGIGNDYDLVGRYLVANPYFEMHGFSKNDQSLLQEELLFPTLWTRHWDTPKNLEEGKFILNKAPDKPFEDLVALMLQGKKAETIAKQLVSRRTIQLQGTLQTFSHRENRVQLLDGKTRFGLPKTNISTPVPLVSEAQRNMVFQRMEQVFLAMNYEIKDKNNYPQRGDHAMCTCRMSEDPDTGVVNKAFKIHGMDNLFIVSNAVFSSGSVANPTLTLVALGMLCADRYL